jgi:Hypothetical protein (DUF2513)
MKRDNDFIRNLLTEIEESDQPFFVASLLLNPTPEEMKKHQHAELMCDAGLLLTVNKGVYRMTNQGHDFLAAIRNDTIWQKTKSNAASVGGVTLSVLKDIAVAVLKNEISSKTGLQL